MEDIRNSKVADLIKELKSYGLNVECIDPLANAAEFEHEYNLALQSKASGKYEAVVLAVSHKEYIKGGEQAINDFIAPQGLFVDVKGLYRKNKSAFPNYWSL